MTSERRFLYLHYESQTSLPQTVVRLWSLADSPAVASILHTQYHIWYVITSIPTVTDVRYLCTGKRFFHHVCSPYELSVVTGKGRRRTIPGRSQMDQVLEYSMVNGLEGFSLPGMARF